MHALSAFNMHRRLYFRLEQTMKFSLCRLAAASVLLAAVTSPAPAQLGASAGFREAFTPDYMPRDMDLFVEFLELEDWQQPIVQVLIENYQSDFSAGVEAMRDRIHSMKDRIQGSDPGTLAVVMQPITQWGAEKKLLAARFVEDVRSQLSEQQMSYGWPRLERAMNRDKELPRGELGGESIDLFILTHEIGVTPDALLSAKEALAAYELSVDQAIVTRRQQMDRSQPIIQQAMVDGDFRTGLAELERIVAARVALRDAQEAATLQVAAALGEPWSAKLIDEALRRSYPTVYRTTDLTGFFAEVRALEGLTADQLARISALEVEYRSLYDGVTGQLLAKHRTEEPRTLTQGVRVSLARQEARAEKVDPNPYSQLQTERERLDEKYRQSVVDILGDELTAKLTGASKFDAAEGRRAEGVANRAAAANRAGKISGGDQPGFGGSGGLNGRGGGDDQPAIPSKTED